MPLLTALRVLGAITEHEQPDPADLEFLKRHALPAEADLPPDDLATEIVRRELAKPSRTPDGS